MGLSRGTAILAIARTRERHHLGAMDKPNAFKRATTRPAGFTAPAHWTNDPVPAPRPMERGEDPDGLDPTRFGDWEKNGIAIDF